MKRGEIWTVAGGADHAGKPRPAVIVQDDEFDATRSITMCVFTTNPAEAPLFRIRVEPNERNGLRTASSLMVDKLTTVPKEKLGSRIGRLDDEDTVRLNQALLVFLGLARSTRSTG
ncbi:MAG: type II toxin-antitoxin system PemK/MazF family toxin [Gemmatimonadota bacterium]